MKFLDDHSKFDYPRLTNFGSKANRFDLIFKLMAIFVYNKDN
jgi:hypothetical protein